MPTLRKLLIANRGEIAIRIARAAEELGITTVAVFPQDDATSLHTRKTDEAHLLHGQGPRAYLDGEQLVAVAVRVGCDALHPGYGFLSESPDLAARCASAGIVFVGPTAPQLALFGDKVRTRSLAQSVGVPVPAGTPAITSDADAARFLASLCGGAALIKAAGGGGGRGMRVVRDASGLSEALARCRSEAKAAFGDDTVYLEEYVARARHIEVQVIGDHGGAVRALGERECSLQRRHQKLVEVAPSPTLPAALRAELCDAAVRMAREAGYVGLGTFELLLPERQDRFVFIEANARLQVEHTITEAVFGVDLVQAQLRIAAGATLAELGLAPEALLSPRGHAIELRVSLERIDARGEVTPAGGTLTAYELPSGPGVRVDATGYVGYAPHPGFDALLAKVVVHSASPDYRDAVAKARRALAELRIEGTDHNLALLQSLVDDPAFVRNDVYTTFVEEHLPRLLAPRAQRRLSVVTPLHTEMPPLAEHAPEGVTVVRSPLRGRVVGLEVQPGDAVRAGQPLAVIEAMKMESAVTAPCEGVVRELRTRIGDAVAEGEPLLWLDAGDGVTAESAAEDDAGDAPRTDLQEVLARHARLLDAARPAAVARRRKTGQRTARENVAALCDPDSFVEYGGLGLAAQRRTRTLEELIEVSPADGLVGGTCTINAGVFGAERARAMVVAYDYTVFAGTQGMTNHKKQDRLFQLARDRKLPLLLFAEGGGGRPGDTDFQLRPMLDLQTFRTFAELSGLVPVVGIVSGRCFAGNAVLLGCCDVIVATEDSTLGLAGPVMIEGAGLGSFPPEAVGPIDVQARNGVVDVRVRDELEAAAVAKQYLSYFQGTTRDFRAPDPLRLRRLVPEHRMRIYDMREVIAGIADEGSVLELRRPFGAGMITALIRIAGRPCGVIANDPKHLAGAIDSDAADKAARLMRLCNAFDLPVLSLCDTPGFMVGPEAEKTALARHTTRMLVAAASLTVPMFMVVVRKGYGLGAMAMGGGSLHAPFLTVAWPTGELGAMGLEGAVLLATRKQLEAITDPVERAATVKKLVAHLREQGKALHVATHLELDDVIDPAETRAVLLRAMDAAGSPAARTKQARAFIDTW